MSEVETALRAPVRSTGGGAPSRSGTLGAPASPPSLSIPAAARLVGVSGTQVRSWIKFGYLEPGDEGGSVALDESAVREVADWYRATVTEHVAAQRLRVADTTVQRWGGEGRLVWWQYGSRRRYLAEEIDDEAERRQRLISMRTVAERYGLPYWILRPAIEDGLVPYESGAKGAYLIDPHDLRFLLECRPCPVCGELLKPGREIHGHCAPKTEEARAASSAARRRYWSDSEKRKAQEQRRRDWWASPAAAHLRAALVELPCPICGKAVVRHESELRARGIERGCCSKECATKYRWGRGDDGVVRLVSTYEGLSRQRWHGRWNGHKGAPYGIETRFDGKSGRPPSYTDEERDRVLEMRAAGKSLEATAIRVFGTSAGKSKVRRIEASER